MRGGRDWQRRRNSTVKVLLSAHARAVHVTSTSKACGRQYEASPRRSPRPSISPHHRHSPRVCSLGPSARRSRAAAPSHPVPSQQTLSRARRPRTQARAATYPVGLICHSRPADHLAHPTTAALLHLRNPFHPHTPATAGQPPQG
ncbi:hypothetical protein PMIN06_007202 [Paraphaeosphaeria minitans]